jgi:hypothetical protein
MTKLTRRGILSSTAFASAAGFVGTARAAEGQPTTLFGEVEKGRIILPSLHAPSEGPEAIANLEPVDKRLGVAVVGLGHLSVEQIMPAFARKPKACGAPH